MQVYDIYNLAYLLNCSFNYPQSPVPVASTDYFDYICNKCNVSTILSPQSQLQEPIIFLIPQGPYPVSTILSPQSQLQVLCASYYKIIVQPLFQLSSVPSPSCKVKATITKIEYAGPVSTILSPQSQLQDDSLESGRTSSICVSTILSPQSQLQGILCATYTPLLYCFNYPQSPVPVASEHLYNKKLSELVSTILSPQSQLQVCIYINPVVIFMFQLSSVPSPSCKPLNSLLPNAPIPSFNYPQSPVPVAR